MRSGERAPDLFPAEAFACQEKKIICGIYMSTYIL